MGEGAFSIEALDADGVRRELDALGEVLWDCVEDGASVNFLKPFAPAEARAFWARAERAMREAVHPTAARVVLVARLSDEGSPGPIVATVQLDPAPQPNQRHRAEVSKLLVLRRARRRGLARALMAAVEAEALRRGRTLLTLDTRVGDTAEGLYLRLGYQRFGVVPRYAYSSAGTIDDCAFFYKELGKAAGART